MASYRNIESLYKKIDTIIVGILYEVQYEYKFQFKVEFTGGKQKVYLIQYYNIESVLRFLIGYILFKEDLVYALVRLYNSNNSRIYSEIYTTDVQQGQQAQLPRGITIIPILFSLDKTALTNYSSNKSAQPVYFTISNIIALEQQKVL